MLATCSERLGCRHYEAGERDGGLAAARALLMTRSTLSRSERPSESSATLAASQGVAWPPLSLPHLPHLGQGPGHGPGRPAPDPGCPAPPACLRGFSGAGRGADPAPPAAAGMEHPFRFGRRYTAATYGFARRPHSERCVLNDFCPSVVTAGWPMEEQRRIVLELVGSGKDVGSHSTHRVRSR